MLGIVAIYEHAAALIAGPEVFGAASGWVDWLETHLSETHAILIGAAVLALVAFIFGFEIRRDRGEGARKRVLGAAVLAGAASIALILVSLGSPPGLESPAVAIGDNEAVAGPSKQKEKRSKAGNEQDSGSRQDEEESSSGAIASAESEPGSGTSSSPLKGGSSSSSPCGCSSDTQAAPDPPVQQSEEGGASPEEESFGEESRREEEQESREEEQIEREWDEEDLGDEEWEEEW